MHYKLLPDVHVSGGLTVKRHPVVTSICNHQLYLSAPVLCTAVFIPALKLITITTTLPTRSLALELITIIPPWWVRTLDLITITPPRAFLQCMQHQCAVVLQRLSEATCTTSQCSACRQEMIIFKHKVSSMLSCSRTSQIYSEHQDWLTMFALDQPQALSECHIWAGLDMTSLG